MDNQVMKLITIRSQIRDVSERWDRRYKSGTYGADKVETGKRLAEIDPETATAEEVAAIIGNDSWACRQDCDECGEESTILVRVGGEPDYRGVVRVGEEPTYGSAPSEICQECLNTAVQLMFMAVEWGEGEMKGTFKLDNPDAMEATITMQRNEWASIVRALKRTACWTFAGEQLGQLIKDGLLESSEFTAEGPEGE